MKQKINRCLVICLWLLVIGLLVYSRFINLGWGLPYPMHPDERNMANAMQQLQCKFSIFSFQFSNLKECFNPRFFAYGQFSLYLGYFSIWIFKGFRGFGKFIITFNEAVMSLRIISAIASIINVFVLIKIVSLISKIKDQRSNGFALCTLIFALSPFAIQFSHFGTTESLLMLFYSLIVFYCLKIIDSKILNTKCLILSSIFSGLAIATKISSIIFLAVPVCVLISKIKDQRSRLQRGSPKAANPSSKFKTFSFTLGFALCTLIFALIFSPHNLINYKDFISAFRYESAVATGQIKVFYTRQFEGTTPYLFQAVKVFPYALGWPVYILSLLGFIFLSWKNKYFNLIRLAILIYFIPTGYIFAKWSRFMAPILPLMLVLAILFLEFLIFNFQFLFKFKFLKFISNFKFQISNFLLIIVILMIILPGISYLSVYQKPDIRFQASKWIYKNIPNNSLILSETANVVDIPISDGTMEQSNNYNVISFDFYNLDEDPSLQVELQNHLATVDYIFVPSRRIFANHPKNKYPLLNNYYEKLFSGKLGFKKVAEFSSGLNDEKAEETWSVFDHPTIRIYKKIPNSKSQVPNKSKI